MTYTAPSGPDNSSTFVAEVCKVIGVSSNAITSFSMNMEAGSLPRVSLDIVLTENQLAEVFTNIQSAGYKSKSASGSTPSEIAEIAKAVLESIKKAPAGALDAA